jgi:predicted cupin superfamily sugar epimerase
MTPKEFSAFHRLQTDENWFHHDGETVTIYIIFPDGTLDERKIGPEVNNFSTTVPRGTWFAAAVPKNFGLVSTTVAPGFEPADVEFTTQQQLTQQYPEYSDLIARYTRE